MAALSDETMLKPPQAREVASTALDDAALAAYLTQHRIDAELCYPGVPTPTVPDAARALGVTTDAIVKSLVFEVEGDACLVIAAGEARIAYKLLADAFGVSRRRLRLVAPETALALTGFAVGAMPPFGHLRRLPTLVDSVTVLRGGVVYGGGGTSSALMRVAVDTLLVTTAARYLPLTPAPEDAP